MINSFSLSVVLKSFSRLLGYLVAGNLFDLDFAFFKLTLKVTSRKLENVKVR